MRLIAFTLGEPGFILRFSPREAIQTIRFLSSQLEGSNPTIGEEEFLIEYQEGNENGVPAEKRPFFMAIRELD